MSNTSRTPYVSDEQMKAMLKEMLQDHINGLDIASVCGDLTRRIRDMYEAHLSEVIRDRDEALSTLKYMEPVTYVRQGPPIQMQDVLLACGELNEREQVAVRWVLAKINALPQAVNGPQVADGGFTQTS